MAQAPSTADQRDQVARTVTDESAKPQLVLVELRKRQPPKQIKKLRKGRGKLMKRMHGIIEELTAAGTVSAKTQQVVVIIIREQIPLPWPFGPIQSDLDDDDNDDDRVT